MADGNCLHCCHCKKNILTPDLKYHCKRCEQILCGDCMPSLSTLNSDICSHLKEKMCQFCVELGHQSQNSRRCSGKVYPSESPRISPEPPSPSFSGEEIDGDSPHALTRSSDVSFSNHPSPLSVNRSPSRTDEQEGEDSPSHFFSTSSKYFCDTSGLDPGSVSARHEFYSFTSFGSSLSDSPFTSVGHHVQQGQRGSPMSENDVSFNQEHGILERPANGDQGTKKGDDSSAFQISSGKSTQPLDFDNNGLIWFPPPPDTDNGDGETHFFTYEDEDDEDGNSETVVSPSVNLENTLLGKGKQNFDDKETSEGAARGYFRALVSQLLQGQSIVTSRENSSEKWLDIITGIAWNAAKFIKPDKHRGGSMDPSDYVKIKCVASGSPSDSKLIKGVVCTKNIKHKRMSSEYKQTRLLLLGGALEYQRVPNQLASFNTLLQQENDHLKTIVSKIEAHRPNVLLVEKSVSSFAQEHLLAKDISLVLNVKRPVLERIARCTGAAITPSIDHIAATRVGHCELFHLEKISEEHEPVNQVNRKSAKTLMFFEGCPRRLGCTVVLRGSSRTELKKVKRAVKFAVFAAYRLSLETSFFADEGSSLPKMDGKPGVFDSNVQTSETKDIIDIKPAEIKLELESHESQFELSDTYFDDVCSMPADFRSGSMLSESCDEILALDAKPDDMRTTCSNNETLAPIGLLGQMERTNDVETSVECYSVNEGQQSIVVSLSSHCMLHGTECERSRLHRIKFYGPSDKPLGRYLRDDLFDQSSLCRACKESAEAHVICYTHQEGNLTINVKHLPSIKLPGQRDGKIWMWHRCLRCAQREGVPVPPVTRRVVMSDAAWGLSFGKFLELSFSNHATGNRVASCGHSLQRDCLRFFGFGSMVAFFRYSPINIYSVRLPPSMLEFCAGEQSWIRKESSELLGKAEALYADISSVLQKIEHEISSFAHKFSGTNELQNHVLELHDMLSKEKEYYRDVLQVPDDGTTELDHAGFDILDISRLRHSLLIGSQVWDRRLYLLASLCKKSGTGKALNDDAPFLGLKDSDRSFTSSTIDVGSEDSSLHGKTMEESFTDSNYSTRPMEQTCELTASLDDNAHKIEENERSEVSVTSLETLEPLLSDKIDLAWSGADMMHRDVSETTLSSKLSRKESPSFKKLMLPSRVYSFDSAQRLQERMTKGLLPSSLYLSHIRSFHASGDYGYMIRDPVLNVQRSSSQASIRETERSNLNSLLPAGARLIVPQNSQNDLVATIYDEEPTSLISYALRSKEHGDWVSDKPNVEGGSSVSAVNRVSSLASDLSTWQSFGVHDMEYMHYGNYTSDDTSPTLGLLSADHKSYHLRISFEDENSNSNVAGKVKFSVICYFAKQFDVLRRNCCREVDFVRSLSRCRRWSAQGGKSNVYFAKTLDERFIIKQVTKTELESFDEFSPEYFKYMNDALSSGSPTCLAKILGIYQVAIKHSKGGKEMKMDLMIMENLFFRKSISKIYDLKGSLRSRYNPNPTGANKVLLDMNLLECMRTDPIFLGSKAKRSLERAVWNDTSFLASIDVMDYSLLVGIDEEQNELVVGIIDFMRQYTWDKHLETWVKASGILGGMKNASPTIVSPKQYKKRFRKAMTTYFLTVPDQWSS